MIPILWVAFLMEPRSSTTGSLSPPSSTAVEMPAQSNRRSVTGLFAKGRDGLHQRLDPSEIRRGAQPLEHALGSANLQTDAVLAPRARQASPISTRAAAYSASIRCHTSKARRSEPSAVCAGAARVLDVAGGQHDLDIGGQLAHSFQPATVVLATRRMAVPATSQRPCARRNSARPG